MGRFDDYDNDGVMPYELWKANLHRALTGKRGQKALADLEAALLALPDKRLIEGALCEGGEVCAVGALGAHRLVKKGKTWAEAFAELDGEAETDYETVWFGEKLGLTGTLTWEIAHRNDETFGTLPPEVRYERMLAWVRQHLTTVAPTEATP